ncbi:Anaphase-promoting complex subunit, partial [Perkinsus olseni]
WQCRPKAPRFAAELPVTPKSFSNQSFGLFEMPLGEINKDVRECAVTNTDLRRALEVSRDTTAKVPECLDIIPIGVLASLNLLIDPSPGMLQAYITNAQLIWPKEELPFFTDGNFAHVHRESSRRYLARALEVCPHFGPAWIALGRSFAANDETERAIQAYRSATKHCPEWHMPWLLIGMEHLRVGHAESYSGQGVHLEHATALTYLERAKDLNQTDSEVRNQIGIYHSKSGDHEQAIKSFIEAIDLENSRKHGRVAAAQTKNFARYQNNLAFSLCQDGQLEEAAEACQKALKAAPNGNCAEAMESHQMLAFVLSKQGRPSQAIDHYHQAIGIGEKVHFVSFVIEIYFIIVDLDRLLIDFREGIDRLFVERFGHSPANLTSHSIEGCVRTLKAIDPDIANFVTERSRQRGFIASMPLFPDAVEGVKYLSSLDRVLVAPCISRSIRSKRDFKERRSWAVRHLGQRAVQHMPLTDDPTDVVADAFITDLCRVKGLWPTPRFRRHILFTRPHNSRVATTRRLDKWFNSEIEAQIFIDRLEQENAILRSGRLVTALRSIPEVDESSCSE